MVTTAVEFYQGSEGSLFRIIRTPKKVCAHMFFIAPLFEQANQSRHHITRSAINAYNQGIESIIFDHFGTGDSSGELIEANLALWQQDLLKQLIETKEQSSNQIYLYLPLSAALLLSDDILSLADGVILLQPEFNGKRFVQQFKRLALVAELTKVEKPELIDTNKNLYINIAGYQLHPSLLRELSAQNLTKLSDINSNCHWFEWQTSLEGLSLGRTKQQQTFASKSTGLTIHQVDDLKFWQATELQIAKLFLIQEKSVFTQLCSSKRDDRND
jgi:exosortase A-associated hydrolase 2